MRILDEVNQAIIGILNVGHCVSKDMLLERLRLLFDISETEFRNRMTVLEDTGKVGYINGFYHSNWPIPSWR